MPCHTIHCLKVSGNHQSIELLYYFIAIFSPKITIIMRIRNVRVLLIKINIIIIPHEKKV